MFLQRDWDGWGGALKYERAPARLGASANIRSAEVRLVRVWFRHVIAPERYTWGRDSSG